MKIMKRKRFIVLAVALVALNTFFWLATSGFALPQGLVSAFFGPRMVRAEVVVQSPTGATQDYRLDQGVIVALGNGLVTLREKNGDVVPVQVDPNVQVHYYSQIWTFSQLRRRMRILVIRLANAPATAIDVLGF